MSKTYEVKAWWELNIVVAGMRMRSLDLWIEHWRKEEGIQVQLWAGASDTRNLRGLEEEIEMIGKRSSISYL